MATTYHDIIAASKTGRYPKCMSEFKDEILNNLTGKNNVIVEDWFNTNITLPL